MSWVFASEEKGWLSELVEALQGGGAHAVGEGRWKSQHRKIVYLSPYVEKPFNSKVIKSFVPELRSRKCFSCFGILVLSIYVMNILCISHISVSCVCYTSASHSASPPDYILCPFRTAGRPTLARPCEGVHKRTSLMSSPLFLQQCPTCLFRLIGIVL